MKTINKSLLSIISFCGFLVSFAAVIKNSNYSKVNANDATPFIETTVEVSEAHLVPVNKENNRYKIVIYFDSENYKPDFDVGTGTIYDTNGKTLIHPVNTYDYASGVKYNDESITVWSGWDNRCEFRQNSLSVMQFAFDFIISPKQGDVLKLCHGMEIPSYKYCTQEGAEPIKYVLSLDYEFRIGSNLDVDKILGKYAETSIDNVIFTYTEHPTRVYDGRLKFHLTNNDYPTEDGMTPSEVYGKNANLWSDTKVNGCGISLVNKIKELNIINSEYVTFSDSTLNESSLAADLGQQVMIYSGDAYKGYFDVRLLNFAIDSQYPNYPTTVTIKKGAEFPMASYLASNETVKMAYRTSEDVTITMIKDDVSDTLRVLSLKDYAEELITFKEEMKDELASYKTDTCSFEARRFEYHDALDKGYELIDSANFKSEAQYFLEIAKGYIDEIPTDQQILEQNINNAIEELEEYYNSLKSTHTLYEGLLSQIFEEGKENIRGVEEYTSVKYALQEAKKALDSVPNDEDARQNIINSITWYKDGGKNYSLSSDEYQSIINQGIEAVQKATTLDELYEIRKDTQNKIDQLKTDQEIRESYKAKVDEIFNNIDGSKYSLESINQLMDLIDIVNRNIDSAKSMAELEKIINDLVAAIEALPIIENSSTEDESSEVVESSINQSSEAEISSANDSSSKSQDEPTKGGCGGSIVAVSSLVSSISLLGLLVLRNRRRRIEK